MDKALPDAIPRGAWLSVRTAPNTIKPGPHEDEHSTFPEPAVGQQPSDLGTPYTGEQPRGSDPRWEPYPDDPEGEWTLSRAYGDPSLSAQGQGTYNGARTDVYGYSAHDDMRAQDTDELGFQARHVSGTTTQRLQLPTTHDGNDASPYGRYGWSPAEAHVKAPIAIVEAVRNPPNNVLAPGSAGTYVPVGPPDVPTRDQPAQYASPDFEGGWA